MRLSSFLFRFVSKQRHKITVGKHVYDTFMMLLFPSKV